MSIFDFSKFFKPLGISLGLPNKARKKPATNDVLEEEFQRCLKDKTSSKDLQALSNQTEMSEKQILSWLRRRKSYGECECMYIYI